MHSIRPSAITCDRRHRTGLTLLELIVSMGLLGMLMVPIMGLMGTSYKVMNASSDQHDGSYIRRTAIDSAAFQLAGSERVLAATASRIDVLFGNGNVGRLEYARGELAWTLNGTRQTLVQGLSNTRFSVGAVAGAGPTAGSLLLIEVATRAATQPSDTWSSTQLWIRPAI